jgi:arylsulfatase A-like enzyme
VEQAGVLGLRQGAFKYIEPGSGPRVNAATNTELGNAPGGQLYRLTDDPGETRDLASAEPGKVEELRGRLDTLRREGRSRP